MTITKKYLNGLTYEVIGYAKEVHKNIGPGLPESVYEKCLMTEMMLRGITSKNQIIVPLRYKGMELNTKLRLDILAEDLICVELKALSTLLPIHDAVLLSYMHLLQKPKGILINFNCLNIFKEGQKIFVNSLFSLLPKDQLPGILSGTCALYAYVVPWFFISSG